MYPGDELSNYATHNSIAWRTAHWQLLEANTIPITYFDGKLIPMPYLLMRHVATGRLVWVANFHNPASTRNRGDQSKWRAKAKAAQIALANRLHQTGVPLIITGDMNEREHLPLLDDLAGADARGQRRLGGHQPLRRPPRHAHRLDLRLRLRAVHQLRRAADPADQADHRPPGRAWPTSASRWAAPRRTA